MSGYLLIESRDPFESGDVENFLELAETLAASGQRVTLFLVQNGVLSARHGARSGPLAALATNGVEVLADDFSLQERGISANRLIPGVKAAPLSVVVDQMADGRKTLWH
jgi:intracellular sulfur oxidation DsrE/DsrF family protein